MKEVYYFSYLKKLRGCWKIPTEPVSKVGGWVKERCQFSGRSQKVPQLCKGGKSRTEGRWRSLWATFVAPKALGKRRLGSSWDWDWMKSPG